MRWTKLIILTLEALLVCGCTSDMHNTRAMSSTDRRDPSRRIVETEPEARLIARKYIDDRGLIRNLMPGRLLDSREWIFVAWPIGENVPVGGQFYLRVHEDGSVDYLPGA